MNIVELIRRKREGSPLTQEEFRRLIAGYLDGTVPDYQMSAFLMACYFRGMTDEETLALTDVMLHSGKVVDLSHIPGVKVDKHSTGGVGDKVSLILAPIVAACGVPVPMVSGRGLGHTGGTLDKLESIPGFRTSLSIEEYRKTIAEVGVVMIGQTEELAPADKRIYALRDVTATVECIPLIAASIMSKKLAEGIDALVLDVKTGRGAFMQSYEHALQLALTLVRVGNEFGKETMGFITDMNQPLGISIGNWLEVVEAVECLRGVRGENDQSADLMELTHVLAGAMLMLGKVAASIERGIEMSRAAIQSGAAYRKFLQLVEAQGGNTDALQNLERFPLPRFTVDVNAADDGFVYTIDSLELGLTSIALGAGRKTMDEQIDPKAGILLRKKVGEPVEAGQTLATLMTDREEIVGPARERIARAFQILPYQPDRPTLIYNLITREGFHPWPPA